jgi:hypothetical protein
MTCFARAHGRWPAANAPDPGADRHRSQRKTKPAEPHHRPAALGGPPRRKASSPKMTEVTGRSPRPTRGVARSRCSVGVRFGLDTCWRQSGNTIRRTARAPLRRCRASSGRRFGFHRFRRQPPKEIVEGQAFDRGASTPWNFHPIGGNRLGVAKPCSFLYAAFARSRRPSPALSGFRRAVSAHGSPGRARPIPSLA